jgi:uncharacterized membrane protein
VDQIHFIAQARAPFVVLWLGQIGTPRWGACHGWHCVCVCGDSDHVYVARLSPNYQSERVSALVLKRRLWSASGSALTAADPVRSRANGGQFSRVLARNIDGLVAARREEQRRKSLQERVSDTITRFTGSLRFVYIHALLFGGWIIWNIGWIPQLPQFDPSFVVLAMTASVEAIFLSTFVLISQNRMQAQAEKRAELDLQISLLAEHEITQMMTLLDSVAHHLGVEHADSPDMEEVKQDVDPRAVLSAIEHETSGQGTC